MATKIRLQRNGRKGYAFYSIVIADARAPRDGRFTEKIGTYNPNTNPATVDLNFERALHWVMCGAQPTDTVRNILSKEGVYMKKHLLGGVAKGAFTEAEAEAKFEAWKNNKQSGLATLKAKLDEAKKAEAKARLEAEKKVNEEIAKKVAEKKAAEAAAKAEFNFTSKRTAPLIYIGGVFLCSYPRNQREFISSSESPVTFAISAMESPAFFKFPAIALAFIHSPSAMPF